MAYDRLTEDDRRRIGDVFEAHRSFVEAVATQYVGPHEAPEVVAEVGLRLCQSLNGLRDPAAIRTWLYRVTVSAAQDNYTDRFKLERSKTHLAAVTHPGAEVLDPDEYVQGNRRRDAFWEALDRLKTRDKRQICDSLGSDRVYGSNDGAGRMALSRARSRLRGQLRRDPRLL